MLIDAARWQEFLHRYQLRSGGDDSAARIMIDDDFQSYWWYFDQYERDLAVAGHVIAWHHAVLSMLRPLVSDAFTDLEQRLRHQLDGPDGKPVPRPLDFVQYTMAPLRAEARDAIETAEARLGPIPPLSGVRLLDRDWLQSLIQSGMEQGAKGRPTTVADVAVALARAEGSQARLDALLGAGQYAPATNACDAIFRAARTCRATRLMAAVHRLGRALLAEDGDIVELAAVDVRATSAATIEEVGVCLQRS